MATHVLLTAFNSGLVSDPIVFSAFCQFLSLCNQYRLLSVVKWYCCSFRKFAWNPRNQSFQCSLRACFLSPYQFWVGLLSRKMLLWKLCLFSFLILLRCWRFPTSVPQLKLPGCQESWQQILYNWCIFSRWNLIARWCHLFRLRGEEISQKLLSNILHRPGHRCLYLEP